MNETEQYGTEEIPVKIKFKYLSLPLKIGIVVAWIYLVIMAGSFLFVFSGL